MNPNLPTSNNNPGDLRFVGQENGTQGKGNFAAFQNPQEGYAALLNDVTAKMNGNPNRTLADFANMYAPPTDGNNSAEYTANLANQLGVSPGATIGSLRGRIGDLAQAIAKNEGYQGQSSAPQQIPPQSSQQPTQSQPDQSSQNPFQSPLTNIASGNGQANIDTGMGALKGALGTIRDVSGVDTNPVVKDMVSHSPALTSALASESEFLKPKNLSEQEGSINSDLTAGLIVPNEVKVATDASHLAAVPEIAKTIASPKQTLGNVVKGLTSFGENPQTTRDAKAIEHLVESKVLKVGNTPEVISKNVAALKNEIVSSAQNLVSRLRSMEIQPTVQPEELNNIFQKQLSSIEKNVPPSSQGTAKETAQWIWNKFATNLPKGKDITAEDILSARKATDHEIEQIKGQNVFDPATETGFSVALRAFRQGANDLLEEKAPDQGAKAALRYQSSLYNVLENVAAKGAPAVKKAQEVADMPGLKGLTARHPYATGLLGASAGLIGESLGIPAGFKALGIGQGSSQ